MTVSIDRAAAALFRARNNAEAIETLPLQASPSSLDEAYAIQNQLHVLLAENGHQVSGHKIGCTTDVMQRYLKIQSPCAGKLFEDTVHTQLGEYDHARFCKPGVECEIAIRLKKDLVPGEAAATDVVGRRQEAAMAVDTVMASIELVDSRWTDFTTIDAPSLIADDFFAAGCVLGYEVTMDAQTIDSLTGQMWINGKKVGEGIGADILGHPLDALVWLADLRQRQGQPLRATEFVTLGSLVQTQWLQPGDEVRIELSHLGDAILKLH